MYFEFKSIKGDIYKLIDYKGKPLYGDLWGIGDNEFSDHIKVLILAVK